MHRNFPYFTYSFLLIFLKVCQVSYAEPQELALKPCKSQPNLSGKCFRVHGRLSLYNGTPSIRLWKSGSKHMFGVSGSYATKGFSNMPEIIVKQLNWENEIWGDYLVCPYTKERAGEMQMVCIEEGNNLKKKQNAA